nr:DUF721 domain-containing protein [uncultured Cetobacterium sp.]
MKGLMNVSEAIEEAVIKSRKLKEGIIRGRWQEIVGKLANKSNPLWIKEFTLYVVVEDTMYLHHMTINKENYLSKIEKLLKDRYIQDIRFKVSRVNNFEQNFQIEKEEIKKEDFVSQLANLTLDEKIEILKKKSKDREQALLKSGFKKCIDCGSMFLGEEDLCRPCSLKKESREILEDKNDSE